MLRKGNLQRSTKVETAGARDKCTTRLDSKDKSAALSPAVMEDGAQKGEKD